MPPTHKHNGRVCRSEVMCRRYGGNGSATLAAFVGGFGYSFSDVDPETISYFKKDGIWFLRFRTGVRDTIVPNVDYWTEEK